jgi:predicted ATPase/class 3 adenylate cyclase
VFDRRPSAGGRVAVVEGSIRTPDQRIRVFISSTLQELAPERAAARDAVSGLRLIPVMFELGARPHPPQDLYRSYLEQSHVFVGIYWQSYGWVAPSATVSGIADEYMLAGDRPRLIYVKEPAPDREPELEELLSRIRDDGRVAYKRFEGPDDLAELLADDLSLLVSERFQAGGGRERPLSGTLTFLFADIEGSTALLEDLGDEYEHVLRRYQALVSGAVKGHGGTAESRPGDGVFCVFTDAVEAVAAAVEIQQSLGVETWPADATVRTRIGLHTGSAVERPEGLVGLDVHRAARVGDAAHGGQILVSSMTAALIKDEAHRRGWTLDDLGEFTLRGLSRPERLHRLSIAGLASNLAPPRASRASLVGVPTVLTSLIGRDAEIDEVSEAVLRPDVRLVTLTGTGGIGKTRMALAVTERVAHRFPDGVGWVPLAAVPDPDAVGGAIAQALGLLDSGRQAIADTVCEYLSDKDFLLVLDNFEQVTVAAPLVGDLLDRAPRLTILVTSRAPLRLRAEHEMPVAVLGYPRTSSVAPGHETLYPAIELFVERARASNPHLVLDSPRLEAIGKIVSQLDGLPLAIELAAARVRYLDPRALAGRMTNLLDLLSGGARDLPERHRTMRATIQWSEQLLDEPTRRLFRWLSVFRGTPALSSVEAVLACNGDAGLDTLAGLESLADVGLIGFDSVDDSAEPRFSMLRVVREFAYGCLLDHEEAEAAHEAHRRHFLELVEEAAPYLWTPQRRPWFDHIERNLADIGIAFERMGAAGDRVSVWRMAAGMGHYVVLRGLYGQALQLLDSVGITADGELPDGLPEAVAGRALRSAGAIAFMTGDFVAALPYLRRSVELLEGSGEAREAARSRMYLGLAGISTGDASAILELFAARAAGEELDDLPSFAIAATFSAEVSLALGDIDGALQLLEAVERRCREADDRWLLGIALLGRGNLEIVRDQIETALVVTTECVDLLREEWPSVAGWPLVGLGYCHLRRGEADVARKYFDESITTGRRSGDKTIVLGGLMGLAGTAALEGDPGRGARLLGASDSIRAAIGYQLWSATLKMYELVEQLLAASGDPPAVDQGRAEGGRLGYEQALALAAR